VWPGPGVLRVGLGCMRLSTDADRSAERAAETIAAALDAGITVFDTARAYGLGPDDLGHNERLLARVVRAHGDEGRARIVTKGGMTRPGGGWVPDGRAKAIRADCEASLAALDGLPIDCYLLHAPDPRTPWRTSVRALGRLVDDGLVARVGVANVNRDQLDEALGLAPIAAVSVALSPFDDRALRGGVVERCAGAGIAVIAHAPLGGPRRAPGLPRRPELSEIAARRGLTAAEAALAWLLDLAPVVAPIPGARRPETARSAARAASVVLDGDDRLRLAGAFGGLCRERRRPATGGGEAVIVMGIPGAGKTLLARDFAGRGYERLNRDERGGSLRALAAALDERLAAGARRVVLDNTYLTRAARSHVVDAAARHGLPARCVWLRTPLAQAQVNMVERLLERFGALPSPEELRGVARREPWLLAPMAQMRALRELEPPAPDEGFAAVEEIEFVRAPPADGNRGVLVAAAALGQPSWRAAIGGLDPTAPHLVFDWAPEGGTAAADAAATLEAAVTGAVEHASCPHPGGPPRCWCRPPLPGLALAFCRRHGLDPARCTVVGTSAAHRTLAATLGARHVEAGTIAR
jgi:aryl-alcohol dehydrogenase-like predicted oxidoreductase/predicted kinase